MGVSAPLLLRMLVRASDETRARQIIEGLGIEP